MDQHRLSRQRVTHYPKVKILIAVTGGLAAAKIPEFVNQLKLVLLRGGGTSSSRGLGQILIPCIKVLGTDDAFKFFSVDDLTSHGHHSPINLLTPPELEQQTPTVTIFRDSDELTAGNRLGDSVLHIQLCEWADIFIVAPLDVNTLAKIALGLADNLVTRVIRAWDIKSMPIRLPSKQKPLLLAPVMPANMWSHPLTRKHVRTLTKELNFVFLPSFKEDDDTTYGALGEPLKLAELVAQSFTD